MTDFWDRAQEQEEKHREAALKAARSKADKGDQSVKDSAKCCCVREEVIPLKRRKAIPGVKTCVACQNDLEHAIKQKRF